MSDTITIKGWVSTNIFGSKCEFSEDFDRADWVNMDDEEKEKAMFDAMWCSGVLDWSYEES